MGQKWSMRAYREGDEDGILELWKATYPEKEYDRKGWLRWWHWMYKENPAGPGRIWLAEHDGRVAGQYSIVPVKMKIADEIINGAQSLDTMTHPNYRHQGIFETLAKETYRQAGKEGIHVVYGFPNEFSYPGFIKKLSWFDICSLQVMIKPLNWGNALRLKINNKLLLKLGAIAGNFIQQTIYRTPKAPVMKDLMIIQISSFDDRIDEFWDEVSNQYKIMIVRNKDYLNWRYSAPEANYSIFVAEKANKICGYLVLEDKIQGGIKISHIFDLIAQSEEVMHCLASRAIEHCQQNKVDIISYSLIASEAYYRVLKRNGFISLPFIKGECFCAFSNSLHISKAFLEDPKSWFAQIGDSDSI